MVAYFVIVVHLHGAVPCHSLMHQGDTCGWVVSRTLAQFHDLHRKLIPVSCRDAMQRSYHKKVQSHEGPITQRSYHTKVQSHKGPITQRSNHTKVLLHKGPITQRSYHAKVLSHKGPITQRSYHTKVISHKGPITHASSKNVAIKSWMRICQRK